MATDWSDEAKARRSAAAKKAAETRKANQAKKHAEFTAKARADYPYTQNSRIARWALSGVSMIAVMRYPRHFRWGCPTTLMQLPFSPKALRG